MKVETLAEQLLFATLRIRTERNVGTGFIVGHKWADEKQGPFLITNKHVIADTQQAQLTFTVVDPSSEDYKPQVGRSRSVTLSEGGWEWIGHPSENIDVAVMALGPLVNHLRQNGESPYYRSIPTTLIPTKDTFEDLDAVEEVLFIGYPNGIYDTANNLPIARRGTTATHPSVDYDGKPVFLIDGSVFPGSSGSPVLVYDKGAWQSRNGRLIAGQRRYLLGILGASFYRQEDGSVRYEEIPTAVKPVVRTTQMIDLGVVYNANTIIEAVEHCLRQRGELTLDAASSPTAE